MILSARTQRALCRACPRLVFRAAVRMASSQPAHDELARVSQTAQAAARLAGRLIKERAGHVEVAATKASPMDLVTAVDKECQEVIERSLAAAHPGMHFLGEESVPAGSEASARAIAELASQPGFLVGGGGAFCSSGYAAAPTSSRLPGHYRSHRRHDELRARDSIQRRVDRNCLLRRARRRGRVRAVP